MNYYEHHLGDYLRDTAHLSMVEDGAYRRLIDAYYIREAPLPLGERDVLRLVRAQSKQDREAVATVLREFFVETDEGWVHSRCDREIERFRSKSEKARASIRARWDKARGDGGDEGGSNNERNTNVSDDGIRTNNEGNTPRARPQTPDTRHQPSSRATGGGAAQSDAPASPPPPFDGTNDEVLNGKHVVALASGWALPEPWGIDAEALGFRPPEVAREAEKFRQYFVAGKGKGTRRSVRGWRQSWSNWLDKAARDKR